MNESIHAEGTASEPQDRVTELIEQQAAISEVLRAIASSPHDLQPIFDAVLDTATRLCRADIGCLHLSEGSGLRLVAIRGDPLLVGRVRSSLPVLAEKGSPLDRLVTGRLPIHIPDFAALEGDNAGVRTGLIVPLLKDKETLGMIALGRTQVRPFTDKQISLFRVTSLRKPPLPSRAPAASGNIARRRWRWRMPTASLPWASSPPRLLMKSSSRSQRHATTPARL
jgi:GAF domain-containing protein